MEMRKNWRRRTILFFAGQSISLFGSQLVQMAIVWHITLRTNSGAWVAAFSVCSYLPQFFVSFLGGVWADRYSPKVLILGADGMIAAVTLTMLMVMPYVTADSALLIALLLMSSIRSAGAGIQNPAVNAVIPHLVPEECHMRYNGINAAMQSFVQFAAPAAAAVVLSVYSLRATLAMDVLTAVIGMGILAVLHLPEREKAERGVSVWTELRSGVQYGYANAGIRSVLAIYGIFLFLTVPAGYLAGLLVSRIYGDTVWYLTAVELVGFGGMMAGGVLMSVWDGFKSHRKTLSAGLALFGTMAIGMGSSVRFELYVIFMAMYGIALTVVQTTITTMLQEKAEHTMHGKIFGLMSALYASCYPMGMAIFGPLADWIPLQGMMAASGAALIVLAMITLRSPHLKRENAV